MLNGLPLRRYLMVVRPERLRMGVVLFEDSYFSCMLNVEPEYMPVDAPLLKLR